MRVFPRTALSALLLFVIAPAASAFAAEQVMLRNGFSMVCDRHEMLDAGMTRLYLASGYMDVATSSVDSIAVTAENVSAAVGSSPDVSHNSSFDVSHANAQHGSLAQAVSHSQPAKKELQSSSDLRGAVDTASLVNASGARHNVNAALLASVVQAESGGNPRAVSRTGARGLMQLMPGTAAELNVQDSFDPGANVNGGSSYLDQLLTRYHDDVALALAAYNAGPAAVDRYHGIPPYRETRAYVAKVIKEFNRRVREQAGATAATAVPAR